MGTIFHGPLGRLLAILHIIVIFIGSLQAAGAFNLMPPKYAAILTVTSAALLLFSERVQGGASRAQVRAAADAAQKKRAS